MSRGELAALMLEVCSRTEDPGERQLALLAALADRGEGGVEMSAAHAPAGGVTVGGTLFKGGEFIPGDVMAGATAKEKAAVKGGKPSGGPKKAGAKTNNTEGGDAPKTTSGPSKPEEREDVTPPSLPEKHKPEKPRGQSKAPKNAEGRPVTGYTASGMTNTAFGDMVESFSKQLGMRSILPEGRRSNRDVATEGSSIDVEYDHSGYAFEIKAVCVEATEYKAKPKKEEMEGKRKYAELHGLKPAMMLIVTDVTRGEAHAYWREGIGAYALNPDNLEAWNYAGKITFPAAKKKKKGK